MCEVAVSVVCYTYNQEQYVKSALDGFLNQKVNFTYEIIVHDDASTDGTVDILKEYKERNPDIIRLILEKENQFSKGKDLLQEIVLPYVRGRYLAFCEGDDFWIYEGKLQRQYDFMEANAETSACYHNALIYCNSNDQLKLNVNQHPSGYISDEDIICVTKGWYPTASLFTRTDCVKKQPAFEFPTGDECMRNFLACQGRVYYMNQAWSVYREFSDGGWNTKYYKDKKLAAEHFRTLFMYFQEFNQYSNGRFEKYIQKRLFSGVDKYRDAHYGKIEECSVDDLRQCINELKSISEHMADHILDQYYVVYVIRCKNYYQWMIENNQEDFRELYIYGAGVEAIKALIELDHHCMKPKGFIISDKKNLQSKLLGIPVYDIKEFIFNKDQSVWPCLINGREEVLKVLFHKKCERIIF